MCPHFKQIVENIMYSFIFLLGAINNPDKMTLAKQEDKLFINLIFSEFSTFLINWQPLK